MVNACEWKIGSAWSMGTSPHILSAEWELKLLGLLLLKRVVYLPARGGKEIAREGGRRAGGKAGSDSAESY